MAETTWAIEANGLSKHFGKPGQGIQALKGVSFTVPKASVYCILGPNGAGKTTLIRILTTLMRPNGGTAKIEGHDILQQPLAVKQSIGVVFQENHFDRYLSIWQNLEIHARMHGLSRSEFEPEITRLLKKVNLYDRRNDLTDKLSGGMQRRVALIRALIHKPKVLFLDEPTTGLDPQARREIWETIQAFKTEATVILTTHYMEEADLLSDTILMVNHGQTVMSGTPRELKRTLAPNNQYELVLTRPSAATWLDKLAAAGALTPVSPDPFVLHFSLADPNQLSQVWQLLPAEEIQRVGQIDVDLETVFLSVAAQPANPASGGLS